MSYSRASKGRKYASVIGRIVENVQAGLGEVSSEENDGVRWSFTRASLTPFRPVRLVSWNMCLGSYSLYENQDETPRVDDFAR
ncbi:hypothetical protein JVT61DRAFT_7899 [Boletus reticuloceps]|nr:hypothetical protein JVT61DRAFT_7899 [Boletus reticuloceps]